jgi:hypothetical protein
MTVTLVTSRELFDTARAHLSSRPEQAGFFLADYDAPSRALVLRAWRPIPPEGFEYQNDYHLTLQDEVRADVIKWAWESEACLVEAHSHGGHWPAAFSPSDVHGLEQWVPRLWWRLRGRPYAAIVTAAGTFDAVAWIDSAEAPEAVGAITVDGTDERPTGETLRRWDALREKAR